MFKQTVISRVGLPRGVWEPLRKLRDNYDVPLSYLAESFKLSEGELLKVLLAARLTHLDEGEEVEGAVLLENLVGEMTHD